MGRERRAAMNDIKSPSSNEMNELRTPYDTENSSFDPDKRIDVDQKENTEDKKDNSGYDVDKRVDVAENKVNSGSYSEEKKNFKERDNTSDGNESIEGSDKNNENKETSEDELNEKQKAEIKESIERIRNDEKLTNEELGNLGEMMMDQYYISKGYEPLNKHRVTGLDDKKGGFKTGIDGVYEKTNPDRTKSYVIADAKYNTSQLSETNDGKQMCDNWIDKRLDDAVGKEKADEIRDTAEDDPKSVSHEVYHIDPIIDENGNIHTDIQEVDAEGNKVGEKTIVEYFDKNGNCIEQSDYN